MTLSEQNFANLCRYPKRAGTPVGDVESWLNDHPEKRLENKNNGGIVKSTDAAVFHGALKHDTNLEQRKAAEIKAQKEYRAALKKLKPKPVPKTPAPILEAAYREFKRVAKDAGTTIDGVLAVKDRQ